MELKNELMRVSYSIFMIFLLEINLSMIAGEFVTKHILKNGLTVLVHKKQHDTKIAVQLCYHAGSKDELLDEKGVAHFLEYVLFKNIDKKAIEVFADQSLYRYNGKGITSPDHTCYSFNVPADNWKKVFPVINHFMGNCSLDNDGFSSAMNSVMQKLKKYKKDSFYTLRSGLFERIFAQHPYHYPLLGRKQDVRNITVEKLLEFYQKHYNPCNAVLVVVGDVDPDNVIQLAENHLSGLDNNIQSKQKEHFFHQDMLSKSLTLYSDIQEPVLMYAFVVPGLIDKKIMALDLLAMLIGGNRKSRLYNKLVIEHALATDVSTDVWEFLSDYGLFFITIHPKNIEDTQRIEHIICAELDDLINAGIKDDEFQRSLKEVKINLDKIFEDPEKQAYRIARLYLTTQDENYIFTMLKSSDDILKQEAHNLLLDYFYPQVMHKGCLLSLSGQDKNK
jgi:zinc protease